MLKLKKIHVLTDTEIMLFYENGETRIIDVSPYFHGNYMGELKNPNYFKKAEIFPLTKDTIYWPNGQDIAPHELYDFSHPA